MVFMIFCLIRVLHTHNLSCCTRANRSLRSCSNTSLCLLPTCEHTNKYSQKVERKLGLGIEERHVCYVRTRQSFSFGSSPGKWAYKYISERSGGKSEQLMQHSRLIQYRMWGHSRKRSRNKAPKLPNSNRYTTRTNQNAHTCVSATYSRFA